MFTGIIEGIGTLINIEKEGKGIHFTIESQLSKEFKPDQSVAHNGVCLTVTAADSKIHKVTAVEETLKKTNMGLWEVGQHINLERALKLGDRLDGHIVQGHVDGTGVCTMKKGVEGSITFGFSFPEQFKTLIIEKGSVCINGVSLTAFSVTENQCSVAIIPFTFEHTTFAEMKVGAIVNLEFDVLGKYVLRAESLKNP